MNLSLSDITISPHLSEETTCFHATVNVDGKPAFTVCNRGQGAENEYRAYGTSTDLLDQAQQWARTLPPTTYDLGGMEFTVETDLDCVIDELLLAHTPLAESEYAAHTHIGDGDVDPEALVENLVALYQAVNELLHVSGIVLHNGSLPDDLQNNLQQVVDRYKGVFGSHDNF